MSIEVRNLSKMFGTHAALRDLGLTVNSGELLALLGPSGSGKTTLLRVIAGLEAPDAGTVHFDGDDATARSATDRRVGFVFQHYALFRHMTVFENVAFGLRVRPRAQRPSETAIRRSVNELLALVQLDYLGDRYPSQLSGGQRQRVALARALAVEPKVLLLDEPFGALDAKVRQELRRWLRRLHSQIHVTSVFVTHDQEEALELADRVVVMNEGRIEQDGTQHDLNQHRFIVYRRTTAYRITAFLSAIATSEIFRPEVAPFAEPGARDHELALPAVVNRLWAFRRHGHVSFDDLSDEQTVRLDHSRVVQLALEVRVAFRDQRCFYFACLLRGERESLKLIHRRAMAVADAPRRYRRDRPWGD